MNSEIIKEVKFICFPFNIQLMAEVTFFISQRKRLHALQEQHSDLLGLLAQQEVELSVFKAALGDKLGSEVVETVEQEAEKSVIDMYGSYTNFRKYALENNANNFGSTV